MTSDTQLVEVGASWAQAYAPVLDFDGWRVAILRHFAIVAPETFSRVERHRNTNEVFLLVSGRADLIVCAGDERPHDPRVISLTAGVAYNVLRAVWHHVVMSPDAHIILFERSDTGPDTTDYAELPAGVIAAVRAQFAIGGKADEEPGANSR